MCTVNTNKVYGINLAHILESEENFLSKINAEELTFVFCGYKALS